jgi:hypothetical protein
VPNAVKQTATMTAKAFIDSFPLLRRPNICTVPASADAGARVA